ncbi:MAG: NADH-quinone oxidoreductase subunit N [Planctomycetota bacterium]|jgi:NADH-quinone oxidoreductase subunit N
MDSMNLSLMLPELFLVLVGLSVLTADLFMKPEKRHLLGWVVAASAGAVTVWLFFSDRTGYAAFGLYRVDGFALFMKKVFGLAACLVSVMSVDYLKRFGRGAGEFFTIVVFALVGMFLVSSVNDLMSMFVSLELVTLSFFILAAFRRHDKRSGEAGIKYIVIGALAAGFMLFGMAFVYGATGEVRFPDLAEKVAGLGKGGEATLLFGLVLLLVGLGFKVASVPFHVWVPDVYQGAPTPVTAFLSVGSKAAGFVLIVRLLTDVVAGAFSTELTALFALLAGLTLFYGNLAAIPQLNIKRLMGYSSIGHAGYLLLGVVAIVAMQSPAAIKAGGSTDHAVAAILFYLFAYVFTNLAVFLGIVVFSAGGEKLHKIDDYAGLSKRAPLLALCMTIALLSLAGVPPLAGFFGKFYLISAVVEAARTQGNGWLLTLAGIGAVNVVVSMYYYLCVVKRMYIHDAEDDTPIVMGKPVKVALLASVIMIIVIGIFQGPFVSMAHTALAALGG